MKLADTLELSTMLTVSTAHIKKETAQLLDEWAKDPNVSPLVCPIYEKAEYGWYITGLLWENCYQLLNNVTLPTEELKYLLLFAGDLGCDTLCLDRDGSVIPYFPIYDW